MAELSEAELVRRCQAGDQTAFKDLVERYKDLVFGLMSRTLADRSRAEDLAQEVFLRIYRGLPYFRGEARLSTWIYRIVANLCLQEQARTRTDLVSIDAREETGAWRREPASREQAYSDVELRDRLKKAMARLPANYRLLIAGHYLKGVRYEDLASALNLPLGTVKTHLHRAKRELRRLLEDEFR